MLFPHKNQTGSIVRPNIFIFILASLIFSVSIFLSFDAGAKEADNFSGESDNNYERLKIFSEVLSLIESSYVEKVDKKTP